MIGVKINPLIEKMKTELEDEFGECPLEDEIFVEIDDEEIVLNLSYYEQRDPEVSELEDFLKEEYGDVYDTLAENQWEYICDWSRQGLDDYLKTRKLEKHGVFDDFVDEYKDVLDKYNSFDELEHSEDWEVMEEEFEYVKQNYVASDLSADLPFSKELLYKTREKYQELVEEFHNKVYEIKEKLEKWNIENPEDFEDIIVESIYDKVNWDKEEEYMPIVAKMCLT